MQAFRMNTKYRNRKVEIDGMTFDSVAEAGRFRELQLMQISGQIIGYDWHRQLDVPIARARQQRLILKVNDIKVATYVADFVYRDLRTGTIVVEDYKGYKTAAYKLKARLFRACLGFAITEVSRWRS
jgi:hypothetical protein